MAQREASKNEDRVPVQKKKRKEGKKRVATFAEEPPPVTECEVSSRQSVLKRNFSVAGDNLGLLRGTFRRRQPEEYLWRYIFMHRVFFLEIMLLLACNHFDHLKFLENIDTNYVRSYRERYSRSVLSGVQRDR